MADQITAYSRRAIKQKKHAKKTAARQRRRDAKKMEDAPNKVTKGYLS